MRRQPLYTDSLFDFHAPLLLQGRFVWHILFWCCYLLYEVLAYGMLDDQYYRHLTIVVVGLPVKMGATYFTLYFLIDQYLISRRFKLFLLLLILSMIVFTLFSRIISGYAAYPSSIRSMQSASIFYLPKLLITLFNIYSLVAIVASFHLIKLWYVHQQTAQQLQRSTEILEREKLAADLKLLKSQINPHFLFNTLNNLYALSLKKSARTPEMIFKLSELMSYMLYDVNQREVPLKDEIAYIMNYIDLERLRYDDRFDVQLNIHDSIETATVAPLLILPFVENAFKHGLSSGRSPSWIRIDLMLRRQHLLLEVRNSKPSGASHAGGASGIGLRNVSKRLDLIYPGRYTLDYIEEPEVFSVVLNIYLWRPKNAGNVENDQGRLAYATM